MQALINSIADLNTRLNALAAKSNDSAYTANERKSARAAIRRLTKERDALQATANVETQVESSGPEQETQVESSGPEQESTEPATALVLHSDSTEQETQVESSGPEQESTEQDETDAEAAARIEAEARADAATDAADAAKRAKRKGSNSEGVARSWKRPEVRRTRLTRDAVTVVCEGSSYGHRSVAEAFSVHRLPLEKHIKFRLSLKASRYEIFEFNGRQYEFIYNA